MARPSPTRAGWAFRLAARVVIVLVRLLNWRVDITGLENVPRRGGAVVTFNHHSYGDFYLCAWAIYREVGRPVRFLAKKELFDMPVVGWILRSAGQVPVARGSRAGRREAFAEAVYRLRSGEVIAIAPEQTISRSFELLPFSTGAARMAIDGGVPIVPSVNWGSQRWATKGRPIDWRARGIPVLVRYGEPIETHPGDEPHEVTERVRAAMAAMLDEMQREYPDTATAGDDWWQPRRLGGSAPSHEDILREHLLRESEWRTGGTSQ
ncbi:MAG: lysophospholipid acyltransferase family protein [Nitriliruptorales bacterium]